eukprot:gene9181-10881_t
MTIDHEMKKSGKQKKFVERCMDCMGVPPGQRSLKQLSSVASGLEDVLGQHKLKQTQKVIKQGGALMQMQNRLEFLKDVYAFRNLAESTLLYVNNFLGSPLTLERGDEICTQDEPVTFVYLIQSGELKVLAKRESRPNGSSQRAASARGQVEVALLGPKNFVGDMDVLLRFSGYSFTVVVNTMEAQVFRIKLRDFLQFPKTVISKLRQFAEQRQSFRVTRYQQMDDVMNNLPLPSPLSQERLSLWGAECEAWCACVMVGAGGRAAEGSLKVFRPNNHLQDLMKKSCQVANEAKEKQSDLIYQFKKELGGAENVHASVVNHTRKIALGAAGFMKQHFGVAPKDKQNADEGGNAAQDGAADGAVEGDPEEKPGVPPIVMPNKFMKLKRSIARRSFAVSPNPFSSDALKKMEEDAEEELTRARAQRRAEVYFDLLGTFAGAKGSSLSYIFEDYNIPKYFDCSLETAVPVDKNADSDWWTCVGQIDAARPIKAFGEIALIKDVPRAATIRAETRTLLLTVDKADYQMLREVPVRTISTIPSSTQYAARDLHEMAPVTPNLLQWESNRRSANLCAKRAAASLAVVQQERRPHPLSGYHRHLLTPQLELVQAMSLESFAPGEYVIHMGDIGDKWYIVLQDEGVLEDGLDRTEHDGVLEDGLDRTEHEGVLEDGLDRTAHEGVLEDGS